MKRGLDEAGEPPQKRGNQRGAAVAPPAQAQPQAARAPVYRLTHTPLPQGTQPFRQLKVEDALAYLEEVRRLRSLQAMPCTRPALHWCSPLQCALRCSNCPVLGQGGTQT